MNPEVDAFFAKATRWQEEMERLRAIVLECGLDEELKWRQPCYLSEKGNVVLISSFKEYCALAFFKGALLKDTHGVLVSPGENSQSMRQIRFTGVEEIDAMVPVLKAYVREAVDVEEAGLKVKLKKTAEYTIPGELQAKFDEFPAFRAAFDALTPGRQRAYILHFAAPKRSSTRASRIEKSLERILEGKGLRDR